MATIIYKRKVIINLIRLVNVIIIYEHITESHLSNLFTPARAISREIERIGLRSLSFVFHYRCVDCLDRLRITGSELTSFSK